MSIWKKNGLTKRILFILTRSPDRNSISGLVIRILLVCKTGSHLCFSITTVENYTLVHIFKTGQPVPIALEMDRFNNRQAVKR